MVKNILEKSGIILNINDNFNPYRAPIIIKKNLGFKGVIDSEDPTNNMICRCEKVTEAEIIDALHRGIEVKSIDGIKRRTRAGMGNCQGNFCGIRVKKLIAKELNIKEEDVTKSGIDSTKLLERFKYNNKAIQ